MLTSVFFDAGNTLVFADRSKTLAPLEAAGFSPTQEQLHAAERFTKRKIDAELDARHPHDRSPVDKAFWTIYYTHLIEALGAPATLIAPCAAATRTSGNWSRLLPGTREVLLELRARGLKLGVISNSDGGIEAILRAVGLGDCFDTYTDSGNVGVEKPNPGIFQQALASLDAQAEASVYVGDSYALDYRPAKSVGMGAVLMDVAGTYRDDSYLRIAELSELLRLL